MPDLHTQMLLLQLRYLDEIAESLLAQLRIASGAAAKVGVESDQDVATREEALDGLTDQLDTLEAKLHA